MVYIYIHTDSRSVLSLALSFSNEPDPFFDEELIAHGSGTVRIQFVLDETDNESELTLGAQVSYGASKEHAMSKRWQRFFFSF